MVTNEHKAETLDNKSPLSYLWKNLESSWSQLLIMGARPKKEKVQPASRHAVAELPLKSPRNPCRCQILLTSSMKGRPFLCCEIIISSAGVTTTQDSAPETADMPAQMCVRVCWGVGMIF